MAVGINYSVVLDEKLTAEKCSEVFKKISKLPGVMSAYFNEKAKAINITHTGVELTHEQPFEYKIRQMEGVKEVKPIICG